MNRLLTAAIALLSTVSVAQAKTIDLAVNQVESNTIYSMQVGGVPTDGVLDRVELKLPEYKRAMIFATIQKDFDGINQLQPWPFEDLSEILVIEEKPVNCGFFLALELSDGGYSVIQPMVGDEVMNWIVVKDRETIDMVCGSMGTEAVSDGAAPIFAYATGDDLYGIIASMWSVILESEQVKGHTDWRMNKAYAEAYEYLGWCSWEQYRKNINEEVLCSAIDHIEESSIPIRWVLIDDGHQIEKRGLVNFTPTPAKFPNGWDPILAKRSDKVQWFGLWHCFFGVWAGISKEHTMDDLTPYLRKWDYQFMLGEQAEGSKLFYEKLVGSVTDPGFDFSKIDVQTRSFARNIGGSNPVATHRQNATNLEELSKAGLSGMMNCMAQNLPCIFNTKYSATTRVSKDYALNDNDKACSHIFQGYQNTSWMSQTIWPDHDMFHSSDRKLGRFMAVSKAMSAAPIYMSDAPEDFVEELILPLAYEDGRILRPLAPGAPLPKDFFANSLFGNDPYSVIAPMTPKSAAIVSYNVSLDKASQSAPISVTINAEDYIYADAMVQPYPGLREVPKEGLYYYDWYNKCGGVLGKAGYSFELENVDDRLVLLCEIESGWAVIGREDKYLSTVAVESYVGSKKSIEITLVEAGTILVYSKKAIKESGDAEIESLGNGLYRVDCRSTKVVLNR